jgi:hypothetical protein
MTHKAMLVTALTAGFLIWGSDKEYGDLNDALMRTMAQDLPPYHQTADTAQARADSGATAMAPAAANPPITAEQTPNSP